MSECSKHGKKWNPECDECEGKCPESERGKIPLDAAAGSAIASRESVALLRLLTSASLMRITIKERATFLTKTTDWERLEDAMKCAEKVLADYTQNA